VGLAVYWQAIATKLITPLAALIFSVTQEMHILYGNWMFNYFSIRILCWSKPSRSSQFTPSLIFSLLSFLIISFYILLHFTRSRLASGFSAKVYQLHHLAHYMTQQSSFFWFIYTDRSRQWEETELLIISTSGSTGGKTRLQCLYFEFFAFIFNRNSWNLILLIIHWFSA